MKYAVLSLLFLIAGAAAARRDERVTFMHEGLRVSARLSLPDGAGPYRPILIVPGSGPNDMDGTIPMIGGNATCLYPGLVGDTLRPYKGLADALAEAGYAVLTYDKVEYSYPNGLGTITFRKLWLPAASGMAYLRTRADIRSGELVLLGHSEGSSLIPYLAKQDGGVSALISLAGPRRSTYDTLLSYQLLEISRKCGGDTAVAKVQGAQVLWYFNQIRTGKWTSATPPFAGVSAAVWSDYIKIADSVVLNYNAFAKPRLFIGLGDDLNVPVTTELAGFQADISGKADFYAIPGLNHFLSTATDPAVSGILTDTIISWLRRELPPLSVAGPAGSPKSVFSLLRDGQGWKLVSTGEALRSVTLYDTNGRRVYSSEASGTAWPLALPELAPGIYNLEVRGRKSRSMLRLQL